MPHQVTYDVVATPIRSNNASILSWPTIMTHYKLLIVILSARYDRVLESRAGGRLSCLIRSPTTLKRRPYDQTMLEP
eukprot:scaffold17514_cov108-Skeletonema_marinoi.AAC.1